MIIISKNILEEAIVNDSTNPFITARDKELWTQIIIDGEEFHYEVSTNGRVRNTETNKVLTLSKTIRDYNCLSISKNNVKYYCLVHRLVALMFIPIPEKYTKQGMTYKDLTVDHINLNIQDNWVGNLRWMTKVENNQAVAEQRRQNPQETWTHKNNIKGKIKFNAKKNKKGHSGIKKINKETAEKICKLIAKGKTNEEISKELDVTKKTIQHIRSREVWKEVSDKYIFPKLAMDTRYTVSEELIHKICKMLQDTKYTDTEIARMLGVKREYVKDIRTKRRRKDISKNYAF